MPFTPFFRAPPFATIGYGELVQRRIDAAAPAGGVEPQSELDWMITHEQADVVRDALCGGQLNASVFVEKEGMFYRVPSEHWQSGQFEGDPQETLFCWGMSDVPSKFHHLPVLFFTDEVQSWELTLPSASEPVRDVGGVARWQKQRVSEQQSVAFKFFEIAGPYLPGGARELTRLELHSRYLDWLQRQRRAEVALQRTAFEKWLDRYRDGWRAGDGRRWELSR